MYEPPGSTRAMPGGYTWVTYGACGEPDSALPEFAPEMQPTSPARHVFNDGGGPAASYGKTAKWCVPGLSANSHLPTVKSVVLGRRIQTQPSCSWPGWSTGPSSTIW